MRQHPTTPAEANYKESFYISMDHSILECFVTFSGVKLNIRSFVLFTWMIAFECLHPPPPISSDIEIGIRRQYTDILKFMLYPITYLRNKYSKSVFSTFHGVGMQIRNLYRISCTPNKSQPTKSFVWQNIDACVNDCNVAAIDLPLAEACDLGALHYMLPALMLGCEPLRRRVDIDGKHPLQSDISI